MQEGTEKKKISEEFHERNTKITNTSVSNKIRGIKHVRT